jgi:sulfate permease, SulP family
VRIVPGWISGYRRAWLGPDVIAGVIVWSVVVPQAVAYAQIAGLPAEAGLVAAPGALAAYALLGTSRTLVVSATTATAVVSAAAVAPLAGGDSSRFAALSAALALVTAVVLVGAGILRLGRVTDLVSKPVMTGFLFGLGLTVAVGQLPKLFGVESSSGNFFEQLGSFLRNFGDTDGWSLAVGMVSIALLLLLGRAHARVPGTLTVLAVGIVVSAVLDLEAKGAAVVGTLPDAIPHPAWPDVGWSDAVALLPATFGIMILSAAEAIGVSRALAAANGYAVDPNRELVALGGSNFLAGLSPGFVQSGGASQTMASERAGGKTQLASLVAAGLILLTGAFLGPVFEPLPQATLGAIVIVAIARFYRVDELVRFARLRTSALVASLVALLGVLVFGLLPGLLIATGVSLIVVIQRLSRPAVGTLARDPESGAWGRMDRHPTWTTVTDVLLARVDGPLFYANAESVKDRLLAIVRGTEPRPAVLVLDLGESADLDVATLDMLDDLAVALSAGGVELRVASVRGPALEMLRRGGLLARIRVAPTLDAAVREA